MFKKPLRYLLLAIVLAFVAAGAVCRSKQRYEIERDKLERQIETLERMLDGMVQDGRLSQEQAAAMMQRAREKYVPKGGS